MLVLSAMLAPASAGEAATSRACCEELLAKDAATPGQCTQYKPRPRVADGSENQHADAH